MITFNGFDENGCKIYFLYDGETQNIKIHIIDGYTKLTFCVMSLKVESGISYFVGTPQNVKHKIYVITDESETQELFRIEHTGGDIDFGNIDPFHFYKDIGLKNISHHLLAIPLYEIFIHRIYDHPKCVVKPNDVVVDVGANIGFFTYDCLYKNVKFVYSVEPNRNLANVISNRHLVNVQVDNIALGNKDGTQNFYLSKDGISSCFDIFDNNIVYNGSTYCRGNDTFERIVVNTMHVMTYIQTNNIDKIDYLKLDCEGAEYLILNAMSETYLQNNIDRMLVEYHHIDNPVYLSMYNEMIEKIKRCGFSLDNRKEQNANIGLLYCWK